MSRDPGQTGESPGDQKPLRELGRHHQGAGLGGQRKAWRAPFVSPSSPMLGAPRG